MAVRQATLVSDESALEACSRRCAIQIDTFTFTFTSGNRTYSDRIGNIKTVTVSASKLTIEKLIVTTERLMVDHVTFEICD